MGALSLHARRHMAGIALSLSCSGCGMLLQTALGWHVQETNRKSEARVVKITSAPAGAQVARKGPDGREVAVGTTPLTDTHTFEFEETVEKPTTTGLWIGCAVEAAAGVALAAASPSSSTIDGNITTLDRNSSEDKFAITGGLLLTGAISDLIAALIHGASSDDVIKRSTVGGSVDYYYTGRLGGFPEAAALVKVPDQAMAHLIFDASAIGAERSAAPGAPREASPVDAGPSRDGRPSNATLPAGAAKADASWVIAVMNVEDINADVAERAIDRGLVRNLGDQIRVFVAQQGVRTVDRGAQDKALKDQISTLKSESYKSCYDDSCQIELGKALAASHILRTRITRFGSRCVLNGELIELRSEVTMAAASSQGNCEAEGFLRMGEDVARNLIGAR